MSSRADQQPQPPIGQAPTKTKRLIIALAIALGAIATVVFIPYPSPDARPDYDQFWFAANALLQGKNPYRLIGPDRTFLWDWPLMFPLPAVVLNIPLALLPLDAARAVFVGGGCFLLAYAATRTRYVPLVVFLSAPFIASIRIMQWAPWLSAALLLPWLGAVISAKPNIGVAVVSGMRGVRSAAIAIGGAVLITVVAFVMLPGWFAEWREIVASVPNYKPYVMRPGGVFLLLGLLRWRRPEARVLVAMACIPSTPATYEAMLMLTALFFFGPTMTFRSAMVVALISDGTLPVMIARGASADFESYLSRLALANLLCIYLPALIVILRRANEGDLPASIERVAQRLPAFIRGKPASFEGNSLGLQHH